MADWVYGAFAYAAKSWRAARHASSSILIGMLANLVVTLMWLGRSC